jgi:hypothetical protein
VIYRRCWPSCASRPGARRRLANRRGLARRPASRRIDAADFFVACPALARCSDRHPPPSGCPAWGYHTALIVATGIYGGITLEKGDFDASGICDGAVLPRFSAIRGRFSSLRAPRDSRRGRVPYRPDRSDARHPCPAPVAPRRKSEFRQACARLRRSIATGASWRMRRIASRSCLTTVTPTVSPPAPPTPFRASLTGTRTQPNLVDLYKHPLTRP